MLVHNIVDDIPITLSTQFTVQPGSGYNQIWIRNRYPDSQPGMFTFNNAVLTCRTNAISDISTNVTGNSFNFGASNLDDSCPYVSYSWNFGDVSSGAGNFSTLEEPNHIFSMHGSYKVCVDVIDCQGCCGKFCEEIIVPCTTPSASFTHIVNCTGQSNSVSFISSGSTGEGLSYLWNFGGNNINNTPNPTYIFSSNGTHIVTLTVTDACGQSAIATQTVEVNCQPTSQTCEREVYQNVINLNGGLAGITFSQAVTSQGLAFNPSIQNNYNNITFVLTGEVTLDVTAVFNGCKFVAMPGALLILNSQFTPAQTNAKGYSAFIFCEFFGCTNMWRGIKDIGNQASFIGGKISDALYGIHAANSGALVLWGVNFSKNFVGLYFTSSPSQTIVGNSFTGGGLLPGYTGMPGYVIENLAGIYSDGVYFDPVTLGFNGAISLKIGQLNMSPNKFQNIKNGIIANDVLSIDIKNNIFENLIGNNLFSVTNTSLSTTNSGQGITINGGGFNQMLLEKNVMLNGNIGIVILKAPLATPIIQNENLITNFKTGIWYTGNNLFGSKLIVRSNNELDCKEIGLHCSNNNGPSFDFFGNTVKQSLGKVIQGGSSGISIGSITGGYFGNNGVGNISENNFNISTNLVSKSININIFKNLNITNNPLFNLENTPPSITGTHHASLFLSTINSAVIEENFFENNSGVPYSGVNGLDNIKNSAICCNSVKDFMTGFWYNGSGTGKSLFSKNKMNNNERGIFLFQDCAIGEQKDKGNTWSGDIKVAAYNTVLPSANLFKALFSQNSPTKFYWPVQDPSVWFEEGTVLASDICDVYTCDLPLGAVTPENQPLLGEIETLEHMLDHNHIVNEEHLAPGKWAKERWLYGYLTAHPKFVSFSNVLDQFYQNATDEVIAFEQFYKNINDAQTISNSVKDQLDQLRLQSQSLTEMHDSKWNSYQETYDPILLNELITIRNELGTISTSIHSVSTQVQNSMADNLSNISESVASLPDDQPYTAAAKMYAQILADHMTLGATYVATHHTTSLQYLAHLCEPLYKETVVLARNMLASLQVHQTYDDNELCANIENRKIENESFANVSIYPNPSKGIFHITYSGKIIGYDIKDISGQLLISVVSQETKCDLTELNVGIYFITVHLENGGSVTKKIVRVQ